MEWLVAPLAGALVVLVLIARNRIPLQRPLQILVGISALMLVLFLLANLGWLDGSISFRFQDAEFVVFSFADHPYSRIVALGLAVTGTLALTFGLQTAAFREQMLALLAILAALGVCFAADFITLFFFWEMVTVFTTGLVFCNTRHQDTCPVFPLGLRYLAMHIAGGVLFLFGILQHYQATGSFLLMAPQAGLLFFVLGIGIKAAFIPFHVWVLWGYPSASLFSSVVLAGLSTKIGVYALARILPPLDGLVLMGAAMAVFGVIAALVQKNLRKLLSYHIISQVGYMVAGVGLGAALSVDGGLLHVVNHMLYKSLLFMSVGTVLYCVGTEDMGELAAQDSMAKPLVTLLPLAFMGALVGALAISGVPPFNGYVSKYLLKSAFTGVQPAALLLTIASIGTAASFSKLLWFGFIRARGKLRRKPSRTMEVGIVLVSCLCLMLGIRPELLRSFLPYASSLQVYSLSGIVSALALSAGGVVLFGMLSKVIMSPRTSALFTALSLDQLLFNQVLPACTRLPQSIWCALEEKSASSYDRLADYLIATLVLILLAMVFLTGH